MSKRAKQVYEFGPFSIDAGERVLLRDRQPLPLTPKAFDLLLALVENSGHLLEKDELMRRLWPDTLVEEANLSNNISLLRKALGDDSSEPLYIETVPRRGYRFIAAVAGHQNGSSELIIAERTRATLTLEQVEESEPAGTDASPVGRTTAVLDAGGKRPSRAIALFVVGLAVAGLALLTARAWTKQEIVPAEPAVGLQPISIKSIAVLPFKPLVADSHDEALELGMTETLITRLSGMKEVAVRSMSAVRKYNSLEQDPLLVGQQQMVDAVLDGNIQKVGERVRVTSRLLRVRDGQTLWAGTFDERLADLFVLQDSISEKVVAAMAVKLTSDERELLTRHPTNDSEAYQLYLRGRHFYRQGTEESMAKALHCFDSAIARDPNYALAYTGKADVYSASASVYLHPAEAMPKAREAAQKALEIDDQLAEAHRSMASVKQFGDWDLAGAEKEYRRALEIRPNDPQFVIGFSGILILQKRFEEAFIEVKRAQELDPLSFTVTYRAGWHLYLARQYDLAIEQFREAIALYPNAPEVHRGIGCTLRQKGMYEEAIAEFRKAIELRPQDSYLSDLGYTYALADQREETKRLLKELKARAKRRYVSALCIARIYAGLGEKDLVFSWLQKGYEERCDHLLILGIDPSFDSVRSDPRFADLLRRLGLEV